MPPLIFLLKTFDNYFRVWYNVIRSLLKVGLYVLFYLLAFLRVGAR